MTSPARQRPATATTTRCATRGVTCTWPSPAGPTAAWRRRSRPARRSREILHSLDVRPRSTEPALTRGACKGASVGDPGQLRRAERRPVQIAARLRARGRRAARSFPATASPTRPVTTRSSPCRGRERTAHGRHARPAAGDPARSRRSTGSSSTSATRLWRLRQSAGEALQDGPRLPPLRPRGAQEGGNACALAGFERHRTPALVESRLGDGKVMLSAFPAHPRWGNLPLKPDFVPLMLRLVGHAEHRPEVEAPPSSPPTAPPRSP